MWQLFLRWGLPRSVIITTLLVVVFSNLINAFCLIILTGEIAWISVVISTVIPLIVGIGLGTFMFRMIFQLEDARKRLRQLSITDELTQAANRRYFIDCLDRELSLAKHSGSVFSVILFDLDDFKQVNDRFGHNAGDEVLQKLTQTCHQLSRATDVFARYGGEEFAFLLPQTHHAAARNFAERIRSMIENLPVEYAGNAIHITASFGVFTWQPEITDLEMVLVRVDRALYQAKLGGKNRIFDA